MDIILIYTLGSWDPVNSSRLMNTAHPAEMQLFLLLVCEQKAAFGFSSAWIWVCHQMHGHAKISEHWGSTVLSLEHHPGAREHCRTSRHIGICHSNQMLLISPPLRRFLLHAACHTASAGSFVCALSTLILRAHRGKLSETQPYSLGQPQSGTGPSEIGTISTGPHLAAVP